MTASVGTLPSAGKLQRGVATGLDDLAELGVFGSLAAPAWSLGDAHSTSDPVWALADDARPNHSL